MHRQHKTLSIVIIFLVIILILGFFAPESAPADADNPILSTRPSESTQPSTAPTEPPTQATEAPTQATEAPTQPPTSSTKPSEPFVKPTVPKPQFEVPSLLSTDAFVYDCRTGEFLFATGDLHEKLFPASITKLFTAYVALQHLKPSDVVSVGNILETLPSDSSTALLSLNDRLSVSDLIYGMLLPSGGDAARVLAVAAGKRLLGTTDKAETVYYDAFVAEMNRQASILGLKDSHFMNPDGYHDPDHYISLSDAARLGRLCLYSTQIMRAATTEVYNAIVRNTGREIQWVNTNKLLFEQRYPEFYCSQAVGLKTGFTSAAGNCLLSAFQLEDGYLIIGAFGSETREGRYQDTLKLFNAATE